MRKRVKKLISIGLIIFLIMLIFCGCSEHTITEEYQLIRIHIRANSNLESDQSVKLEVRDAVTSYLESKMQSVVTVEDAYTKLNLLLGSLTSVVKAELVKNGFYYGCSVELNNEYFPTRSYQDIIVESGYYDALIINLGEASGDNWWCVIYPPLCYLDPQSTSDVFYKSFVKEFFDKYFC